jgi:hypothetical protein
MKKIKAKKQTIKQFLKTGILFALTCILAMPSAWAQNYTDVASAQNAIKNASLNSVITINGMEWYVVKKYPATNSTAAMLVSRRPVQVLGPIPFNLVTNHNNIYEGSNLQSKITYFYDAYSTSLLNVIKQIAVQPVIGNMNDNLSTNFVTNPKLPTIPVGSQKKDVLFALTYRDAWDWNGTSNFIFNANYYFRWWTRTGNSGVPTYAYEVNIHGGTINGTADVSSNGTIDVVVGVWVSCGAQPVPETTVIGTVFPFVCWNTNEFDSLFPITVNLKSVPNPQSGDPLGNLINETPLYSTEAIYYNGSIFAPNSPKSPGIIGALNNYGLPVNWIDAIHVQGSDPVTNILQVGEKPVTVNGLTLGLYKIENVKKGDYILEIKREGFVTRWAKIKVDADGQVEYLGHRELVPGDINNDYTINLADASTIKMNLGSNYAIPSSHYISKYDLNADGNVDQLDLNLILKFTGFWFYHYQETKEWLDALEIQY